MISAVTPATVLINKDLTQIRGKTRNCHVYPDDYYECLFFKEYFQVFFLTLFSDKRYCKDIHLIIEFFQLLKINLIQNGNYLFQYQETWSSKVWAECQNRRQATLFSRRLSYQNTTQSPHKLKVDIRQAKKNEGLLETFTGYLCNFIYDSNHKGCKRITYVILYWNQKLNWNFLTIKLN